MRASETGRLGGNMPVETFASSWQSYPQIYELSTGWEMVVEAPVPRKHPEIMNNAFLIHQVIAHGIARHQLDQATKCCVKRLARGVFIVVKVCNRHHDFVRYVDNEAFLDVRSRAEGSPQGSALHSRVAAFEHVALAELSPTVTDRDILSRETAALIHGIPLLTSPDLMVRSHHPEMSQKRAALIRSKASVRPEDRWKWKSRKLTSPARTALDIAHYNSLEAGVVALDHVILQRLKELRSTLNQNKQRPHGHRGEAQSDGTDTALSIVLAELREVVEAAAMLARSRRVRRALELANGQAESPAETLARLNLLFLGITDFEQQVTLQDPDTGYTYRVDFLLLALKIIIEIDGLIKYVDETYGGYSSSSNTLVEEKKRTYRLERMGYKVVRVMWRDLLDLQRFAQVLRYAGVPI